MEAVDSSETSVSNLNPTLCNNRKVQGKQHPLTLTVFLLNHVIKMVSPVL